MSTLLKLREWVTVADAATYLGVSFGEDVTEADVLRLALDSRLPLSIYFVNHGLGRVGKCVSFSDAKWEDRPEFLGMPARKVLSGLYLDQETVLEFDGAVKWIEGVWDLAMLGNERIDVEEMYQRLTGGPAVELIGLDGAFVNRADGVWCQLHDKDEYGKCTREERERFFFPAGRLPDDAVLVVRTAALRQLERSIAEPAATERSLETRERTSLLTIIAALAEAAGLSLEHPSKTAQVIERLTETRGTRLSARAIENHITRARQLTQTR
jgi:hypothetical protein